MSKPAPKEPVRSVEEMLAYTLRRTCEHYGWSFGVAFRSTWGVPSALGLTPPITYASDPGRFASLERLVRGEPADLSDRLPGQAFRECRALWSDDLSANLPASLARTYPEVVTALRAHAQSLRQLVVAVVRTAAGARVRVLPLRGLVRALVLDLYVDATLPG